MIEEALFIQMRFVKINRVCSCIDQVLYDNTIKTHSKLASVI